MLRCIREIKPRWIVGENVLGLVNWNGGMVFEEVQADLEAEGYEVQPYVLPAAGKGAPHLRQRVWFVAHAASNGHDAKSAETNNYIWKDNQQSRPQRERTAEGFSDERNATNTNGSTKEYNDRADNGTSKEIRRENESDVFGELCSNGNATDSECIRLEHSTEGGQIRGEETDASRERSQSTLSSKTNGNGHKSNWDNFPTVSPICFGDDGLSNRLDGITFPKWRNESIKAAGNAVVPQLILQLFKAIHTFETQNLKP
jgi:DNA (cytosine-5)-methyltransferase 1